ncbi:hypothetical protein SPHINGOT1_80006 [Sphingomonas sp. T1]|nr:hypothetical protein SPHINGOT1_80006 [Sphingomonas sp. T1]
MGRVYGGDYEHNAIRRLANGKWRTIAQDPRILWPDTLSIGTDGYLYFTANQLQRQATFHEGRNLRREPYELLRIKIGSGPVLLRRCPPLFDDRMNHHVSRPRLRRPLRRRAAGPIQLRAPRSAAERCTRRYSVLRRLPFRSPYRAQRMAQYRLPDRARP